MRCTWLIHWAQTSPDSAFTLHSAVLGFQSQVPVPNTESLSNKSKPVVIYPKGNLQSFCIIKLHQINHYRWGCWIQSRSWRKNQIMKDLLKKKEQAELNTLYEPVIYKLSLLSIAVQQQTKLIPLQNFLHHCLPLTCFLSFIYLFIENDFLTTIPGFWLQIHFRISLSKTHLVILP